MSITLNLRSPNGTTGAPQDIPGEGDINTREEAEAALSLLSGDHANDEIVAGSRTYTRSELTAIRDGQAPTAATQPGTGASHVIRIEGNFSAGLDAPYNHRGGGARITYGLSIPFSPGSRGSFTPVFGAEVSSVRSSAFTIPPTPGGEPAREAHSGFTRYNAVLGGDFNLVMNRFMGSLGVRIGIGGFTTPRNVTPVAPCMPGDVGRAQCEPTAGPVDHHDDGLVYPSRGYPRATSGGVLTLSVPISAGAVVSRGAWGNASLFANVEPGVTILFPRDGNGYSVGNLAIGAGINIAVGGHAAERPQTAPSAPNVERRNLISEQPAANETWALSQDFLNQHIPAGARVRSVAFDGMNLSGPPYRVPANWMTPGTHTLTIGYLTADGSVGTRELTVTVAAPQTVTDGAIYGIEHNETITRPAATIPAPSGR